MKFLNKTISLEDLCIKQDKEAGLIAIIAIHNTKLGPALGGCRFVKYDSVDAAIADAIKLAEAMTYKSALAGLPLGGGKAVIIQHDGITDRRKIFEGFGDLVEKQRGKYITASDSGTSEEDMKIVATRTQHVTSINKSHEIVDDTAAMTAAGLMQAIQAAVHYRFKKDNLKGLHVAIQGVGSVGFLLAKLLLEQGVKITLADKNTQLVTERAKILSANTVDPDRISEVDCDIFAPCALGGIIDQDSIAKLKAPIICGAANNQLFNLETGEILYQKNILYVPDYVANAGGVICACAQAGIISKEVSYQKVKNIYNSVLEVISLSHELKLPTNIVANSLAEKKFT